MLLQMSNILADFVDKALFTSQEHVKTTRTDKTLFFLLKKEEVGTQQTIVPWCPVSVNQI